MVSVNANNFLSRTSMALGIIIFSNLMLLKRSISFNLPPSRMCKSVKEIPKLPALPVLPLLWV